MNNCPKRNGKLAYYIAYVACPCPGGGGRAIGEGTRRELLPINRAMNLNSDISYLLTKAFHKLPCFPMPDNPGLHMNNNRGHSGRGT